MKLLMTHREYCDLMKKHYDETLSLLKEMGMSDELKEFALMVLAPTVDFTWSGKEIIDIEFPMSESLTYDAIQKYGDRKEQ